MSSWRRPSLMVRSMERFGGGGGSKASCAGMWCGKSRGDGATLKDVRAAAMCARRVVRFYT